MSAPSVQIIVLVACLLAGFQDCVRAARSALPTGGARLIVDGREVSPDVAPTMVHATIMVPLRFIGEALGARVSWDPRAQTVTIRSEGRTVTARIGDPIVRSDGRELVAHAPPQMIQGRAMVPLRVIGDALGVSVGWDERTKTVAIGTAGAPRATAIGQPVPAHREEGATRAPLQITLRTDKVDYRAGEPVQLTLEARNTGAAPVTLRMSSGQKYDFELLRGDTVVWKWSDDRMFTQALVDMTVAPNQTLAYHETWTQRDRQGQQVPPGEYTAAGYLTTLSPTLPRARRGIRILPAGR